MSDRAVTRANSTGAGPSDKTGEQKDVLREKLTKMDAATQNLAQQQKDTSEEVSVLQKKVVEVYEISKGTEATLKRTNANIDNLQQDLRVLAEESRATSYLMEKVLKKLDKQQQQDDKKDNQNSTPVQNVSTDQQPRRSYGTLGNRNAM